MLCVNLTLQVSTQHKRICRDSVAEWCFLSTYLHRTFQASTLHKRLGPNCAAVQSFTCVCLHVILQVTLLNKRLRAGSEAALSLPCVCVSKCNFSSEPSARKTLSRQCNSIVIRLYEYGGDLIWCIEAKGTVSRRSTNMVIHQSLESEYADVSSERHSMKKFGCRNDS